MKKGIIFFVTIIIGTNLFAQQSKAPTKTISLAYSSTTSETRDDELTYYWMSFNNNGTTVGFEVNDNEEWADGVALFFINNVRGSDKTKTENVGKKYLIEYQEFGGKIISAKPATSNNSVASIPKTNNQPSVKIGNQVWMQYNLDVSTYRNGDIIPEVQDFNEWMTLKTGAWCYNQFSNKKEKLYNWYAVTDQRGLAPIGWHIPSRDEWELLISNLGGGAQALSKMKSTSNWEQQNDEHEGNPDFNGTNESGFSALPTGYRDGYGDMNFNSNASWWCATEYENFTAFICNLYYEVNSQVVLKYNIPKNYGYAVRCILDK